MITAKYIPKGTKRRSGILNKGIRFIVCHDTGNDGSTALQNVDYYIKSANEVQASAHAFVDDFGVIECIPTSEKAWHVRYSATQDNDLYKGDANDFALGIELCFTTRGNFDSKKAYENYVEYMRDLCEKYSLDPTKHLVAHATLDPTRRTDPLNAFSKIGKTWENFIEDVSGKKVDRKLELLDKAINALTELKKEYGTS